MLHLYGQRGIVTVNKQKYLCISDSGFWNFAPQGLGGTYSRNGLLGAHSPFLIFTFWGVIIWVITQVTITHWVCLDFGSFMVIFWVWCHTNILKKHGQIPSEESQKLPLSSYFGAQVKCFLSRLLEEHPYMTSRRGAIPTRKPSRKWILLYFASKK